MPMMAAILLLSGCDYNEKNFEGLDQLDRPTDVVKAELTFEDYASLKGDAKTNGYFSDADPAKNYLPAWLAGKYLAADEGSSVKVTFKYQEQMSPLLNAFSDITYYKLSNADYKIVHGAGYYANYLNKKTASKLYQVLADKIEGAELGDVVFAEYNYAENGVPQKMEDPIYSFDFETLKPNTDITANFNGWFVKATGGNNWKAMTFDENIYPQFTANGAKGAVEGWLISPKEKVKDATINLSFDINVGYYNGNCLSVLVSTNFDGENPAAAKWTDITANFTIPTTPTNKYGTFASAGIYNLAEYAGQEIRVAFKYVGNGASGPDKKTTTYQFDNFVIGKDIPLLVKTEPQYALMEYTTKGWYAVNNANEITLTPADYLAMGEPGKNFNFSSTIKSNDYLPTFLAKTIQYPLNEQAKVIVYRYYNGKATVALGDEYIYSSEAGRWELNTRVIDKAEQYVLSNGNWNFDPSTVVTLSTSKTDVATSAFYQAITDWVKVNKGAEFVTSFGNNDYYYGGSAYNNNFDFRISAWRGQAAAAYAQYADDKLTELMFARLPEAFIPGLLKFHSDADIVSGLEVTYTINFSIYDGKNTLPYTIKYLVTGKAQFEYIKDSFKEVK